MQIVYAPVGGFYAEDNYYLKNIGHGFDVQVLETLCDVSDTLSVGEADIFYLSKHPQNLTQATINALEDRHRIVLIDSLQNLQDTCCLVTTTSHIAYAYTFYYQKPAIFFMPSFNSINIDAPQFIILQIIALFAHSLNSLKEQVLFCMRDSSKSEEIAEFLGKSLI
ncbi:MAG: hypothetical protein K2O85_06645 [Helicobacter sp.]|nr:hypothetical protein [Helicobacter sp.]